MKGGQRPKLEIGRINEAETNEIKKFKTLSLPVKQKRMSSEIR